MVDMQVPPAYVQFLSALMPAKPCLSSTPCWARQAGQDDVFPRLASASPLQDEFIVAPGIRGLVTMVFTFAAPPYVFKRSKDVFGSSKCSGPRLSARKYQS